MRLPILVAALCYCLTPVTRADGPTDNLPDKVRRIPPSGIKISEADRAELEAGVAELGKEIESLGGELKSRRGLVDLLPDVQIYHKAVDWALRYDEFYKSNEAQVARALLQQGIERAKALADGRTPWLS